MQRTAPCKSVAFEAATSIGTRVRFTAREEDELMFDACDPATGELIGQIAVSDPHRATDARRSPRMLASEEWTLDSIVQVEVHALNAAGELYGAVTRRVG